MTRKKALKDIVEREALQMALGLTDIDDNIRINKAT